MDSWKTFVATLILGAAVGDLVLAADGNRTKYEVIRAFRVAGEPACMPALTRAPNGDLLVAFGTEWEPYPWGGILKLTISRDRGKTWSPPVVLWKDPDPRVTIQVANGMQTLSNGDVLLPVTYCLVPKRRDVRLGERDPEKIYTGEKEKAPGYRREVRFLRSKDSGHTWTIETPDVEQPSFRFGRLIETRDRRLIMPGDAWYVESRDFGKTWGAKIAVGPDSFNETNIIEAIDGTLSSIMRQDGQLGTRRVFGTSFSRDFGRTWTPWRWSGVQGKMPDAVVLPAGRILLAVGAEGLTDGSQVVSRTDRSSFCSLFLSDDSGQSWKRDVAFSPLSGQETVVPGDSPVMCDIGNGEILAVMQGIDRAKAGHPLLGYSVGMSLIGNVIKPVSQQSRK